MRRSYFIFASSSLIRFSNGGHTPPLVVRVDGAAYEIQAARWMAGDDVVVEMEDAARPFDPTRTPAVDIAAELQHRSIGGLGRHFVRRGMDEMTYRRADGHNQLRMTKRIGPGRAPPG